GGSTPMRSGRQSSSNCRIVCGKVRFSPARKRMYSSRIRFSTSRSDVYTRISSVGSAFLGISVSTALRWVRGDYSSSYSINRRSPGCLRKYEHNALIVSELTPVSGSLTMRDNVSRDTPVFLASAASDNLSPFVIWYSASRIGSLFLKRAILLLTYLPFYMFRRKSQAFRGKNLT